MTNKEKLLPSDILHFNVDFESAARNAIRDGTGIVKVKVNEDGNLIVSQLSAEEIRTIVERLGEGEGCKKVEVIYSTSSRECVNSNKKTRSCGRNWRGEKKR